MTTDRSDAIVLTFDPVDEHQAPTRHRFEPRSDGRWRRVEERYSRGEWRPVGSELVERVSVENAD